MASSSLSQGGALPLPPEIAASIGRYNGWLAETKFAFNPAVGTSYEDVWNEGGTESYLSSAETMDIVSTDGADKGTPTAGTGARTVQIYGLDSSWNIQNEIVTLDGTNPVTTANTYLRVYRLIVRTAGNGGANAGDITATASTAATVHAKIGIGDNQTLKSQYTVPNGYYAVLRDGVASTPKNDQAEIRLEVRPENEVFQLKYVLQLYQQTQEIVFQPSPVFSPKSDIRVRAKNIGGTTISVAIAYDFYLVPASQVNL